MQFKQIFEQAIVDPPIRDDKKPSKSFHPSAASIQFNDEAVGGMPVTIGGCLRAEYYRITGEPTTESSDAAGILKMNAGSLLQPLVERAFQTAGLWRASETSFFHKRMNISGRVDFWLVDNSVQLNGSRECLVPVECKTTGKYQEAGMCYPKAGKFKPKTENLLQVIPYLDYYGQYIDNIKLVLLYLGRDSMMLGEHHVRLVGDGHYGSALNEDARHIQVENDLGVQEYRHLSVRGVYRRFLKLRDYLQANQEPPPDYVDQYSNKQLVAYARAGADYGALTATECKTVLSTVKTSPEREFDDSEPILDKGAWNCRFCGWYTRCRAGIKHVPKPLIRQEGQAELFKAVAPTVEDVDSPI